MLRILALLAVAVGLSASAPPVARAADFGLSEQQATSFADGRLRALGVRYARLIAPWNAATSEPARVQAWLDAVAAAGMTPHVAFEHLRTDHCPGSPCVLPTRAQYREAFDAFRARFPQVTTFTTWNEANHSSQPVAERPEVVAGYWAELTAACPGCTVVSGDVLDSGSYVRWLKRFQAAAPATPQRWGLHNYGDVTYGTQAGTDAVLAAVPGELWIEETGGIVTLRNAAGHTTLSSNEARAAESVNRAFAIAATRPRITRMYLYHWKANTLQDRFDAGLVRPDGTIRASYANAQARLAEHAAAATKAPTAARPAVSVSARWSTVRRGQLLVRVKCVGVGAGVSIGAATAGICRGRLAATIRTKRTSKSGTLMTSIAKRRVYATTAAKTTTTLRLNVPRALRTRLRGAAIRRVAITVTESRPAAVRATSTLRLAKP